MIKTVSIHTTALEKVLELYSWFALIVCSLFFIVGNTTLTEFVGADIFFISTLIAGTYAVLRFSHLLQVAPFFFLFQGLSLLGLSYELNFWPFVYLSLVPAGVGTYYFLFKEGQLNLSELSKGHALTGVFFLCSLVLWLSFFSQGAQNSLEFFVFATFCFMAFTILDSAIHFHLMSSHPKSRGLWSENQLFQASDYNLNQERYFVHDLINHTHGLNIYLSSKVDQPEGLSLEETQSVLSEVKSLQSLIKDHYQPEHKNLMQTYEWVNLKIMKNYFNQICENYFFNNSYVYIDFSDSVEGKKLDSVDSFYENSYIHFPSFYRVTSNIIKNISEQSCPECEIHVAFKKDRLILQTKNRMKKGLDRQAKNLDKDLEKVILTTDFEGHSNLKREKLGLSSAYEIARANGGVYQFWIESDHWFNYLELPIKNAQVLEKVEEFKKSA